MLRWLTPRGLLALILLGTAPVLAIAHLCVTWLPSRVAVRNADREIAAATSELDAELQDIASLWTQLEQLRARAALIEQTGPRWLAHRDRDHVFDTLAGAFCHPHVILEQLVFDDPALYAAASDRNLLACEVVNLACSGDYAGMTSCLENLARSELPLRVASLTWGNNGEALVFNARLEVPFMPDAELRAALAKAAGLEDKHAS